MIDFTIERSLKEKAPDMVLGVMSCSVTNTSFNEGLWDLINQLVDDIRAKYTLIRVKEQVNIAETRRVYKACGKDPNRYRPAAESLYRRIIKGNDLYRVNTLVDLVNLLSLRTGFSIGGFDADRIEGSVKAGIGRADEDYIGIGRGKLNIENLPVLRDQRGPIATPTSDEVRTAIHADTSRFLMNINAYTGEAQAREALVLAERWLTCFCQASLIKTKIIH